MGSEIVLPVLAGVGIGLVGCVPTVYLFTLGLKGDHRASIQTGLAGVLCSFCVCSALLLLAYIVHRESFLAAALGFTAAYVVLWTIASVRAWRAFGRGDRR